MASEKFKKVLKRIPEEIKKKVSKNVQLGGEVHRILSIKGWSQSDLAKKMKKSESEVSKWLSGFHNFTFQTIMNIEEALGEKVIYTASEVDKIRNEVNQNAFNELNEKVFLAINKKMHSSLAHHMYRIATKDLRENNLIISIGYENNFNLLNKRMPPKRVNYPDLRLKNDVHIESMSLNESPELYG